MAQFFAERSELLLSVQSILIAEAQRARPLSARAPAGVTLQIEPLGDLSLTFEAKTADTIAGLVASVAFRLAGVGLRIYRSGSTELTILMQDARTPRAGFYEAIEERAGAILAERGLPRVRLRVRSSTRAWTQRSGSPAAMFAKPTSAVQDVRYERKEVVQLA